MIILFAACSSQQGVFSGKKTPHEQYADRIDDAGLKTTVMGSAWFTAATQVIQQPVTIQLPYKETGFFAAEKPTAAGYRFEAKRGLKLSIIIAKKPVSGIALFADLWKPGTGERQPKLLATADTMQQVINYEIEEDGFYIVRIQPELLQNVEYSISITTGPSLAFPVPSANNPKIGSFWGDNRDAGARKHEGIDIFGKFRTPVVASADGVVSNVTENNLGGKVVFIRPEGKNYSLYYAHLDSQVARQGERIRQGELVGLMGNTGNARTTATHLHFGIYSFGGAIDPLPFVQIERKDPPAIMGSIDWVHDVLRAKSKTTVYAEPLKLSAQKDTLASGEYLYAEAAAGEWYKVQSVNGTTGFVHYTSVAKTTEPLRKYVLRKEQPLLDKPSTDGLIKTTIAAGKSVDVLANYQDHYFVRNESTTGWIKNESR